MLVLGGLYSLFLVERIQGKIEKKMNWRREAQTIKKQYEEMKLEFDWSKQQYAQQNFCWQVATVVALLALIAAITIAWYCVQQMLQTKNELQVRLGRYEAMIESKNERIQQLESGTQQREKIEGKQLPLPLPPGMQQFQPIGQATPFVLAFPGRF